MSTGETEWKKICQETMMAHNDDDDDDGDFADTPEASQILQTPTNTLQSPRKTTLHYKPYNPTTPQTQALPNITGT